MNSPIGETFELVLAQSSVLWSNLFKVARTDGGNPSASKKRDQLRGTVELLELEAPTFAPRRVLLLSGRDRPDGSTDSQAPEGAKSTAL